MHPLNKIKLAGTVLAIAIVALVAGIEHPDTSHAQNAANAHGFLWSDMPDGSDHAKVPTNAFGGRGLGWISVNGSDPGAGGNYGVSLDANGAFSGYGWSEFGGWVDFAPAGPYPAYNAATPAKIMPSCFSDASMNSCKVIGWIRFVAPVGQPSQTAGGWDGWVSLNSDIAPTYHVMYDKGTGQFSGFAWGSTVAGWIDFSRMSVDTATILLPSPMKCADANGGIHIYTPPDPIPAVCVTPPVPTTDPDPIPNPLNPADICGLIPGNQVRPSEFPMQYDVDGDGIREWYGLSGGHCARSVCSNHTGFWATPPSGEVPLPDGTCAKPDDPNICIEHPTWCVGGKIRPIYRED